ncbi:MAG: hypothetical protein JWN21_1114 [Sphingomonas bacterium]|uniref:SH3 domain-containing protein n=1 Tax=Sphingomonas bacterium TaxID=1895847 RepID=UPI00260F1697|nr:SH3 domain-containing protein [Sphingomonas bacterium]MDB5695571.1 hypothetical protein [Sphingomonas bacterium]
MRGDLADVRLAQQVFAPHYAQAMPCIVIRPTVLRSKSTDGEEVAALAVGDTFELLEVTRDRAWGIAPAIGLVGYCDRLALELA